MGHSQTPATPPMFERVLGSSWAELPIAVRDSHDFFDRLTLEGVGRVTRPRTLASWVIAMLVGFPNAAPEMPLIVTKYRNGTGEVWERKFKDRTLRSYLNSGNSDRVIVERFGLLSFEIHLDASEAGLCYPVARGWCAGIPMPKWALPKGNALEFERDGRFHFDVKIDAPLGFGPIIRYQGWLVRSKG